VVAAVEQMPCCWRVENRPSGPGTLRDRGFGHPFRRQQHRWRVPTNPHEAFGRFVHDEVGRSRRHGATSYTRSIFGKAGLDALLQRHPVCFYNISRVQQYRVRAAIACIFDRCRGRPYIALTRFYTARPQADRPSVRIRPSSESLVETGPRIAALFTPRRPWCSCRCRRKQSDPISKGPTASPWSTTE
jgi:hypothetical protein